jgi:hypothetical protein
MCIIKWRDETIEIIILYNIKADRLRTTKLLAEISVYDIIQIQAKKIILWKCWIITPLK